MGLTRRKVLAGGSLALAGCAGPPTADGRDARVAHTVSGTGRVGFVGDLLLARGVEATHGSDPAGVWDGLAGRLRSLDGLLGNLECTLSTRGEAWPGKTWRFRADPDYATAALSAAGVSAVSLANNHAMDYGPTALGDTFDALDDAGINHAGAGTDRRAALAPATFEAGDLTVAVVGLTDRFAPFAAGRDSPGTAHLRMDATDRDARRLVDAALSRVPRDVDLVVASLHWGPNYEPKTRTHRRFARWLIDRGVDVVHGHSAHEVHGVEVHRGRPICYDTGDFVDDLAPVEGHYNGRSFLFELEVDDGLRTLVLHPVEIDGETVRPAGREARRWLHGRIRDRSARYGTAVVETNGTAVRVPLE